MIRTPQHSAGITLLEAMLVLAIAASIILAGLNVYRTYETDKEYFILKTNVDLLFVAMKNYYQQECNLYFDKSGTIIETGKLVFTPGNYASVAFDVSTANQYLSVGWPRMTSLTSRVPTNAYLAQFNPNVTGIKNAYVCFKPGNTVICDAPLPILSSNIILWQSQIAVRMNDPKKASYYVAKAGADCAVNSIPTNGPVNCATSGIPIGGQASYLVWQRMPSFSSSNVSTPHWMRNPVLKIFKLQYTHDPMYELSNPNASPAEVYKSYLCGG
jgi:hypothetical protein